MKAFVLTSFALVCFALNSILCRMALATGEIDGASFTLVRLVSGAVMLAGILLFTRGVTNPLTGGNWSSTFFLFVYAIAFSLAYLGLPAATGALILFGFVQLTMVGVSIAKGERPTLVELAGLLVAAGGLTYLVFPGISAPPLLSSASMAAAGIAWGFYTLRGKGSEDPLADTAGNFVRSVPMIVVAAIPFLMGTKLSARGVLLAVLSGTVASGIGYAVWYSALRFHSATRAGVLQLSVPLLAAVGGVVLLGEVAGMRLAVAGALILGGIGITIGGKQAKFSEQTQ